MEENSSNAEKIKQIIGKLLKLSDWFDTSQIDITTSVLDTIKRNFMIKADESYLWISSKYLQNGLRKIIPFS